MKVEAVHGPKFSTIVRKRGAGSALAPAPTLSFFDPEDPLTVLVGSYLLWESSPTLAADAATRMATLAVDANELRVMLEPELVEAMGPKYPFVEERAARLRSTLNDIYRRQHRTSLDHLRNAARKDQRSYLDGLADIPSFVVGRTLQFAFDLPAPIVDETMVEMLVREEAVQPTATLDEVVQWIGRNHKQDELPKVNVAMQSLASAAWDGGGRSGVKVRSAFLARHAGFREAAEREERRIEEERLAKIRAAEEAAEAKRLAEIAKAEARLQAQRDAEEARKRARAEAEAARLRAKAEREAARVAAALERERAKAAREAERVARQAAREKEAERRRKEAEKLAARKAAESARKAREVERKRLQAERAAKRKAEMERRHRERAAAKSKAAAKPKAVAKSKSAAKRKVVAKPKKAAKPVPSASKKSGRRASTRATRAQRSSRRAASRGSRRGA